MDRKGVHGIRIKRKERIKKHTSKLGSKITTATIPRQRRQKCLLVFLSATTRNGVVKLVLGNGAKNDCWRFLAQSLGTGLLSLSPATAPEMLVGIS